MENRELTYSKLEKYQQPNDSKYFWMLFFTIISFFSLLILNIYSYSLNPFYSLFYSFPLGILMCRYFVIEHDCGHQSFFSSKRNNTIGGSIFGFLVMIPNTIWNYIHDVHHGRLGNLDERKANPELWTMTLNEYKKSNILVKIIYRFMRSMFVRLFITPLLWMLASRIPFPRLGVKVLIATIVYDIIYGIILYFIIKYNWLNAFVIIYLIPLYLFLFMASIMFYLQHQFEDTSWEKRVDWDLYEASINGSSYVKLKPFMRWITGNVGCHHVHHLNTKIASYNLHEATIEIDKYLEVDVIYLKELFHHLNCALWDEDAKKLIPFSKIPS
jgi:omega-6 fatty acid desaturase (delta-12 desaturase)